MSSLPLPRLRLVVCGLASGSIEIVRRMRASYTIAQDRPIGSQQSGSLRAKSIAVVTVADVS